MYNITKGELIFILDTVEEILATGYDIPVDELQEIVTICNGLLDHGVQEHDND